MALRIHVLAVCALFATGCSTQDSGNATTTSDRPRSIESQSSANSVSIDSPTLVTSTTSAPRLLLFASFGCGPADGPWVGVTIVSAVDLDVIAQLQWDGQTYGQSAITQLEPGTRTEIGLDPATPPESFGQTAQVHIVLSENPAVAIASTDVLMKIPDGISCG